MKEIRFHGIGGQGAVTGAEMLAAAFLREGKHTSMFPVFGGERRGAPVLAFLRFDDKPVRQTSQIYEPDCLVILAPRQVRYSDTFSGLRGDGIIALNTSNPVTESPYKGVKKVGFVDAIGIALEEIGRPIPNTTMLGAFAKATGWLSLDSIVSSLGEYFEGARLQANINCVQRGFERAQVVTFGEGE